MNICFFSIVTFWHGVKGGMDLHGKQLLEGLAARGHKVIVITTRHPYSKDFEEINGIRIYYLKNTIYGSPRKGWGKASRDKFKEIIRQEKIDIAVSQSKGGYGIIKEALARKIPLITIMHGYETMILYSVIKQVLNFKKGWVNLGKTLISSLFYSIFMEYPLLTKSLLIISPSADVANVLASRPFIGRDKIKVISYGIDLNKFVPSESQRKATRKALKLDDQDKVILFLSLISRQKGADIAIRAIKKLLLKNEKIKLILGGDGEYLPEAIDLANRLGISDKVIFPGFISNKDTSDYYNAADIFIFPTLRFESFGIVLAEAMACGKPVVASKIGSIPDVIDDGVNGILVPSGDYSKLAEKIDLLLNDKRISQELSENAKKKAHSKFGIKRMVDETLKVFGSVAS